MTPKTNDDVTTLELSVKDLELVAGGMILGAFAEVLRGVADAVSGAVGDLGSFVSGSKSGENKRFDPQGFQGN